MKAFPLYSFKKSPDRLLIVYGTGALGEIVLYGLQKFGICPDFYCDHDPDETTFHDIPVLQASQLNQYQDSIILVAFKDFLKTAIHILDAADCRTVYHILPLLELDYSDIPLSLRAREILTRAESYQVILASANQQDSLSMQHLEVMVTQRCTLKCRDCSALVPFFKHPADMDIAHYLPALDRLIHALDYIGELSVLGGETFLQKNLVPILQYANSPQIGMVALYTNAMVLPDKETLCALQHSKVWVHISDYGINQPHIEKMCRLFQEYHIKYFVRRYDSWQAGGDLSLRNITKEDAAFRYAHCFKARCYSFYLGQLHCCARSSNAMLEGLIPDCREDYVDFTQDVPPATYRKALRTLLQKDCCSACFHCNGLLMNQPGVTPAIQCN